MGVECCNAGSEENLDMQTMMHRQDSSRRQSILQNAPKYLVWLEEDEYRFKDEAYDRARSLDTW